MSSHRFRRRLAWAGSAVLAAAAVVVASIWIGNTGKHYDSPLVDKPAWVYKTPTAAHLSEAQRRQVMSVMSRFIETAVARRQLDASYDMAAPELRGELTRADWRKGNIPVVPFPSVGIYDMILDYSYTGDVAFDVALIGNGGGVKTFMVELKQDAGKSERSPWRVAAWVPRGVGGGSTSVAERHREAVAPPQKTGKLSATWLLIPVGILGLILLVPAALGVRNWRLGRRALREYESTRELPPLPESYTSSSSPS